MECRTPLFVTPPRSTSPSVAVAVRPAPSRYSRYGSPASPPTPPPPAKIDPIPLPLPKNVVLMAMLEAAERQAKLESDRVQAEEDDEMTRIVKGVETLAASCGTYAVADAGGLAVVPTDPRRRMSNKENTAVAADDAEPFVIERGQKIQVVEMVDGVAILARGMGFVVASENQLVKGEHPT
jgi:hypothetical protein